MGVQSSYSRSYDFTSGQDAAHKVGQERSQLEAEQDAALYDGDPRKIWALGNRIRDLKRYLSSYGSDPNAIEVIPRVRLAQEQYSDSASSGN